MNCIKNKSNIVFYSLIVFILLIGIFSRTYMWINKVAWCDDSGPIASILSESTDGNVLYPQENYSLIQKWINGIKTINNWHWTYAPLQFVLPVFMLDGKQSYQQKILIGRLPSFLFSILSIIVFAFFLLKVGNIYSTIQKILIIYGLALLSLNFEIIYYAGEAEPYAVTIFGSLIILWLFEKSNDNFWKWNWLVLTLLCYTQWQFFYIVFIFYFIFFISALVKKNKEAIKDILLSGETTLLLNIPNLFFFIKRGMFSRGIQGWNVGPNREYLFQPWLHKSSIIDFFSYTFSFVCGNIIKIYKYLFVPAGYLGIFSIVFSIILIIFTVLGIIKFHKKETRIFAFFIDALIILVAVLVIKRKLTLSPTRHILIYQPFIAVCIINGINYIIEFISNKTKTKKIAIFFIICFLLFHCVFLFIELPLKMNSFKNTYSEKHISSIIENYNPDIVVTIGYDSTINLFLSNISGYQKCKGYIYKSYMIKSSFVPKETMIVMGYNTFLSIEQLNTICKDFFQNISERIANSENTNLELLSSYKTEYAETISIYELNFK